MTILKTEISNIEVDIELTGVITLINRSAGQIEDRIELTPEDFEDLKMFVVAAKTARNCIENWSAE